MGYRHHDAIPVGPDGIESSIGRNHSMKAFESAVVIAWQAGNAAEREGLGPCFAAIGRAREQKFTGAQSESGPTDIQVAFVRVADRIGNDIGLVFKRNSRSSFVGDHWNCIGLPCLAAIERAPDEDAVASSAVGPILAGAKLVKGDVAQDGMAIGIVGDRDIAGDSVVLGSGTLGGGPGLAA